jgi:hypothetical protein
MLSLDFPFVTLFRFPAITGLADEFRQSPHDTLSDAIGAPGCAQHQIGTRQRRQRRK